VSYTLKEVSISPGEKPEWFTALYRSSLGADLSSDGKVPVMVDGPFVLTESAVVAEYLIGKYGSKDTIYTITDPEERARATIFAEQQIPKVRERHNTFTEHMYACMPKLISLFRS
jgi:glutathione S-transferase